MTLATLAMAAPAAAQSDAGASVYRVHWAADLTMTGVAAAAWLTPGFFIHDLVRTSCTCDTDDVPSFDRTALGRSSSGARTGSDVALVTMLAVPPLLDVVDVRRAGGSWAHVGEDMVVIAQAVAVNGAFNELTKIAVHRPRPFRYHGEGASDPDSYLSFYSGHTSTTFAVGTAYATTFALRHPDSVYRYVVIGVVVAGGAATGTMRVLAGKHFPSDVVVGALVGSAIGVTLPLLHRRREVQVAVFPGGVSVSGAF